MHAILQVGMEGFNLLNHTNPGRVSSYYSAAGAKLDSFGTIVDALNSKYALRDLASAAAETDLVLPSVIVRAPCKSKDPKVVPPFVVWSPSGTARVQARVVLKQGPYYFAIACAVRQVLFTSLAGGTLAECEKRLGKPLWEFTCLNQKSQVLRRSSS